METSIDACMNQLEAFRKSDAERDVFVSAIVKDYAELKRRYDDTLDDLSNERDSRRRWQGAATERERELQERKQASSSNNFVVVIIDGDGALFQDTLYSAGKEGGSDAAHRLHSEIQSHLRKTYPRANVSDWSIVVQVFLNLQGLSKALVASGSANTVNDLPEFGRSFGLSKPLFSYIDVGSGKERADHKVRETLRLYMPIHQCKHVYFAPCHDNGYLPVLESYKHDSSMASRLTLIETRPAEPGFIDLGLERIRMTEIFRSEDLPTRSGPSVASHSIPFTSLRASPSVPTNGLAVATPPNPPLSNGSTATPDRPSWALVGSKSTSNKTINIAPKPTAARPYAILNAYDERLDLDLPHQDPAAKRRINDRMTQHGKNLCNAYHIQGQCPNGSYCEYLHGERITPAEVNVLKHKARSRSCPLLGDCRDVHCIDGHICKFGKTCHNPACYFVSTHQRDTEPAKRAFEDGTEEWIPSYISKFGGALPR